ncbi:glucokinase [Sphingomonas silueang]|uniref:glucokinase n=1 Tax=Sphingomonas silueang TaxID=3156617 RepID=UPI0032B36550
MTPPTVLAAIGPDSVEFALQRSDGSNMSATETVAAARYPTFSDALIRYADRHRLNLYGTRLCVAVAGAIHDDAIRVTNGRWYVSRSGLFAVTGRDVAILNDVSAIAHATLDGQPLHPFGTGRPRDDPDGGCSIVVFADRGLGAATLHRDGTAFVTASEAGHIPFTPQTAAEGEVARFIRSDGCVTYEEMLIALMRIGFLLRPATFPHRDDAMLATILGRYCAMVALTSAAWNGVYLCGSAIAMLDRPAMRDAFCDAFRSGGPMRNRLREMPFAIVEQRGAILRGLAAFSKR